MSHQEKKRKHINSLQSLNDVIHWSSFNSKCPIRRKKRKHINSLQSLNDVFIPLESSTLNVPSGEKTETHINERCHPLESFKRTETHLLSTMSSNLESFNSKCPSGKKQETHQFSPILERCIHWSSSTLNVPSGEKTIRKHINSLQSLNDAIHWSPSTLNVPSGEKNENTIQFSPSHERCHHWSPSTLNVPSGEKTETHQFSQSLNDAIHWSSSTLNVPSGEKTETSIQFCSKFFF
ncbi:hypothetical protein TNCV_3940351 [Trichonephila clavipes]|uniref:Uncharacterized protein n=1 Tax=Trichonephila clavipes TaxID=2585209 RepID=A0A8X6VVP7_TRICX|nr:hypothetical protein TNCV_3940351 [Trichonephila clavipes]